MMVFLKQNTTSCQIKNVKRKDYISGKFRQYFTNIRIKGKEKFPPSFLFNNSGFYKSASILCFYCR